MPGRKQAVLVKKFLFPVIVVQMVILVILVIKYAGYHFEMVSGEELRTVPVKLGKGVYEITAKISLDDAGEGEITFSLENVKGLKNDSFSLAISDGDILHHRVYITANDLEVYVLISSAEGQVVRLETAELRYLQRESALTAGISWLLVFLAADVSAFIVLVYFRNRKEGRVDPDKYQNFGNSVLFLLFTSLFVSIPLFSENLYFSHDVIFHLNRIYGIARGLPTQFPVRIQPFWMNDYGYAAGVCYGDVLLYLPAAFYMAGFPLRFVYKGYVFLINFLTAGISSYSFGIISGDKRIGKICGFLYTFSIWRMTDLYTRGALGEYSAMAFLPLLVLGIYLLLQEKPDYNRGIFFLIMGASGIIQTHVLTAIEVCVFLFPAFFLELRRFFRPKTIAAFLTGGAGVLLLNAGLLVPLADYYLNVPMNVSGDPPEKIQGYGALVRDLFAVKFYPNGWKALTYEKTRMTTTIGLALMAICVMAVFYCVKMRFSKDKDHVYTHIIKIGILILASFFMSTCHFPYDWIEQKSPVIYKVLGGVEFPWRYLTIAQVLCALLAALLLSALFLPTSEKKKDCSGFFRWIVIGLCAAAFLQSGIFQVKYASQAMEMGFLDIDPSYSFLYTYEYQLEGTNPEEFEQNRDIITANVMVEDVRRRGMEFEFHAENISSGEGYLELPVMAYKGYHAYGENLERELTVERGSNNRLRIFFPENYRGRVSAGFEEPWYWRCAEWMSVVSFLVIIVCRIKCGRPLFRISR